MDPHMNIPTRSPWPENLRALYSSNVNANPVEKQMGFQTVDSIVKLPEFWAEDHEMMSWHHNISISD